jgi:hypothetical protein
MKKVTQLLLPITTGIVLCNTNKLETVYCMLEPENTIHSLPPNIPEHIVHPKLRGWHGETSYNFAA